MVIQIHCDVDRQAEEARPESCFQAVFVQELHINKARQASVICSNLLLRQRQLTVQIVS